MASTDKPVSATKSGLESGTPVKSGGCKYSCADVLLRASVFATTLVSIIIIVTSNQTEMVPYPVNPLIRVPVKAKFSHSPAFIYFLAAMCVTCLYSIITALASLSVIKKPACKAKSMLHFALLDVMALGLVASATGAAGGVAYIGMKGNSHVNWLKICNVYDTFCKHVGASIALSLVTSILLVLLISLSICSLHSKINRC